MEFESLKNIPQNFKILKLALFITLAVSLVTTVGALFWSYSVIKEYRSTAYVLTEDGRAVLARGYGKTDMSRLRKPEIINHIKVFHKLFFEIDQFNHEERTDQALYLIGNSGKDMYKTFTAKRYYSNLSSNNLSNKLIVDSIVVEERSTPYLGAFYGKIIVKRTDQELENVQNIFATFEIHNVNRTLENPHGLLIENYNIKGF